MEILLILIIAVAIGGLVWVIFGKPTNSHEQRYPSVYRSVLEEDKYIDWTGPHQTFVAKPRWTDLNHLEIKEVPSQADIIAKKRKR